MDAIKKIIESGQKCIVRTDRAGVFFGKISEYDNENRAVEMKEVRRIWYWSGAASLSQLAKDGPKNPKSCKFPEAVEGIVVLNVKEIIPCTEEAIKNIEAVWNWKI